MKLLKLLFLLSFPCVMFAGTTGKLTGVTIDKKTGEFLPGVNIMIEGTTLGASTDVDGFYVILNIPAGTYKLRAEYVGYQTLTVKEVLVLPDKTKEINFELSESSMTGEVVEILAKREVIRKDATSTEAVVNAKTINNLPVQSVMAAAALTAGVTTGNDGAIHIRGGRSSENGYMLEGVNISGLGGQDQGLNVSRSSLENVTIITGAYDAEYGEAQSGIVSMVLPEGGQEYKFGMKFDTDQIGMEKNDWGNSVINFNTSGHLFNLNNNPIKFFVSGEYKFRNDTYRNHSRSRGAFTGKTGIEFPKETTHKYESWDEQTSTAGKLAYNFNEKLKVAYTGALSFRKSRDMAGLVGGFNHSLAWYLLPENDATTYDYNQLQILNTTYTFNSKSYLKFQLSHVFIRDQFYVYDEQLDGDHSRIIPEQGLEAGDSEVFDGMIGYQEMNWRYKHKRSLAQAKGFPLSNDIKDANGNVIFKKHTAVTDDVISFLSSRGDTAVEISPFSTNDNFRNNWTAKLGVRADYENQLTRHHLFKTGFQYRQETNHRYEISNINVTNNWGTSEAVQQLKDVHGGIENFEHVLNYGALYAQDKMEYNDLIIRVGLRGEFYTTDADIINISELRTTDLDYAGTGKKANPTFYLSPRLGIAHPVTEDLKVFYNYAIMNQFADRDQLFAGLSSHVETGIYGFTTIGNPNLKPERTTTYEFGLSKTFENGGLFTVAYFNKNSKDHISRRFIIANNSERVWLMYDNLNLVKTQGLDFKLSTPITSDLTLSANYTYQNVEQLDRITNAKTIIEGTPQPSKYTTASWDRPHSINANLLYFNDDLFSFSILANYNSGEPYTPSVKGRSDVSRRNTLREPDHFTLDLNIFREFKIGEYLIIRPYINITNLLNRENAIFVDRETGSPEIQNDDSYNRSSPIARHDWLVSNYDPPRHIRLGFDLNF